MDIVLTNGKCKVCGVKLTEYEILEKDSQCIDCYRETEEQKAK
jgi:predicted Zn-ribbon and HTH transcriptional regulator